VASKKTQAALANAITTTATGAAEGEAKTSYETMVIGVPRARKEERAKLDALATKLGCKPSALVWLGIGMLLSSPPTSAPAGATANTGSAPGFWVVPTKDNKGKATAISVVEVASRGDAEGRTFFRFKAGDTKGRERALNQAKRAAQYDSELLGLKGEPAVALL
jgi:hypothetical protein